MASKTTGNTLPIDEFRALDKLPEHVAWLENNRHHFASILARGPGSPGFDNVLGEYHNLNHEVGRMLSALRRLGGRRHD